MKSALLKLHVAVILAGFTAIIGKWVSLSAVWLVFWRVSFSLLIFIFFFYKSFIAEIKTIKHSFRNNFFIGMILAIHWVFFFESVKRSNVSIGVSCLALTGFFTSIVEPLITKNKIKIREILLGLCTFLGISIVFNFHPQYKYGIFLGVLSALCAAIFPSLNKRELNRGCSGTTIIIAGFIGGLAILLPLAFLVDAPLKLPTQSDILPLGILVILCTFWAFYLQMQVLRKLSAFTISISYNLEPIYGVVLGLLLLNESKQIDYMFFVGFALILAAILIQTWLTIKENGKKPDKLLT